MRLIHGLLNNLLSRPWFDPKTITKGELNKLLRSFYVEVGKEDGTLYKKTSSTALRFGLQREIKKIRPYLNITDDPVFQSSSEIFKAQWPMHAG